MSVTDKDVQFLAHVPLLSALNESERTRFSRWLDSHRYEQGQVIIWEGKPHDNLHILVEGRAVVTKVIRGEVESVLTRLDPRAHFGELNLIDRHEAAAAVTAESDCRILSMPQHRLLRLMEEDSQLFGKIAWSIMRDLAAKLRETNLRVLEAVTWGLDATHINPNEDKD